MWTEIFLLVFGLFGTFVHGQVTTYFHVKSIEPENWQETVLLNEGDNITLRITLLEHRITEQSLDLHLPYYSCTIKHNGKQIIHNLMTGYNMIQSSATYDQEIDQHTLLR